MALNKKPISKTPDEIQQYEEENGCKLISVSFASENNEKGKATFLVKKPSRQTLFMVADVSKEKGSERANDLLINSCLVAGDIEELKNDDDMFFGLLEEISKLVEKKSKI